MSYERSKLTEALTQLRENVWWGERYSVLSQPRSTILVALNPNWLTLNVDNSIPKTDERFFFVVLGWNYSLFLINFIWSMCSVWINWFFNSIEKFVFEKKRNEKQGIDLACVSQDNWISNTTHAIPSHMHTRRNFDLACDLTSFTVELLFFSPYWQKPSIHMCCCYVKLVNPVSKKKWKILKETITQCRIKMISSVRRKESVKQLNHSCKPSTQEIIKWW